MAKGDFDIDVRLAGSGPLAEGDFKGNVGTSRHGFSILRKKRLAVNGTLSFRDTSEHITGTGYFQKVMVNAPAPPWFWGTVHMGDGSYVQYFQPHIGLPMLRRSQRERSPFNAGKVPVAKSIEYYDSYTGRSHRMRDVRVKRKMVKGHPVFRLASREKGVELDMEVTTYARACWRFQQPLLGPISTLLYYNEYPSRLTELRFTDGDREVTIEDVGGGIGNAEHSWGLLF
ncbi:MAG: hypothetical protein L0Z54_02220 [Thermoplasmata archaeon]|nr:hypothetical protein [Thermoplasmata archaeon]